MLWSAGLATAASVYFGLPWAFLVCLGLLLSASICFGLPWAVSDHHRMDLNAGTYKWIGLDGMG